MNLDAFSEEDHAKLSDPEYFKQFRRALESELNVRTFSTSPSQ